MFEFRDHYILEDWDEGYLVARDLLTEHEYAIVTSEADPGTPFLFVQYDHPYLVADNTGLIMPHELPRLQWNEAGGLWHTSERFWGKLGTRIYREEARQVSLADTAFLPSDLVVAMQDADTQLAHASLRSSMETPRFAIGFKFPEGKAITAAAVLQEYQKYCARAVAEGQSNYLHDVLVENWETLVIRTLITQYSDMPAGLSLPKHILRFKQMVNHDYKVRLPSVLSRHLLVYKPKRMLSTELRYCETEVKRGDLAVKFLDGVGRGLYKLHLLDMAFRDLKLGNTLINEDRAELTDFDSVASLWVGELTPELVPLVIAADEKNEVYVVAGKSVTTSHAAPEQLDFPGDLELDPEANIALQQCGDVYSLGICLWQILARATERGKPFIDPSSGERLTNEARVDNELIEAWLAPIMGDAGPAFINTVPELRKMTAYASAKRPELLLAIVACLKALAKDGVASASASIDNWEDLIANL